MRERVDEDLAPNGPRRLASYLTQYKGASYEPIVEARPYAVTEEDLDALGLLNVGVLEPQRSWILGEGRLRIAGLLKEIPTDKCLEDLPREEFDAHLGNRSPAWELWQLLRDQLRGGPSARKGYTVTAGKILFGKRPSLLPLYDSITSRTLHFSYATVWEKYWFALQDEDLRVKLERLRVQTPDSTDRSLVRIIDILGWMA